MVCQVYQTGGIKDLLSLAHVSWHWNEMAMSRLYREIELNLQPDSLLSTARCLETLLLHRPAMAEHLRSLTVQIQQNEEDIDDPATVHRCWSNFCLICQYPRMEPADWQSEANQKVVGLITKLIPRLANLTSFS